MPVQLQSFSAPVQFLGCVKPMLEARETENNLMLGMAIRLVEHPEWIDNPPYLACILDEGVPVLAASITPPHNILLAADPARLEECQPEQVLNMLVQDLRSGSWEVPGVLAEKQLAGKFAEAWSKDSGKSYRAVMRERVYELRKVQPLSNLPPGYLRQAAHQDSQVITRWNYAFSQEALGKGTWEEADVRAVRHITAGDVFVWDDGGAVSMAYRARPTPHGSTVTGVYTPPELRRRGYATACVAGLSQRLLDSGKMFCNLFTDLANPTSNAIYQKIGYQPVCDFTNYGFED